MGISDITTTDLQDDIIGPIIIKEYKAEVSKRMEGGAYMNILAGYHSSVFRDLESYIRTEIDLVEDDIRLVLDNYSSSFITYELKQGIYRFGNLFEALFNILQPEYRESNSKIVIEFDDITRKTKLFVRPGIIAIRFDEKSFFSTILGFAPDLDHKHYTEYISQKIVNSSATNKRHLNCDVIDGSVVNGLRQSIL